MQPYRSAECRPTNVDGVRLISPTVAVDARGVIQTLHNEFSHQAIGVPFVEDKISVSRRNVLRGFHGDFHTGKLVACLQGCARVAVVDARLDSATYGKWQVFNLDDANRNQLYVPPGVFNAHLCLSPSCIFWYKLTALYEGPAAQRTLAWDSVPAWPMADPILSERDQHGDSLAAVSGVTELVECGVASGYFNPLHRGHLDYLEDAKRRCERLIVIVNNDRQVRLKGREPFMPEADRLRIVQSLAMVSEAVLSSDYDRTVNRTLRDLSKSANPRHFYNGGDVTCAAEVREAETCRQLGIELKFMVGGTKTASSSELVKGAKHAH